MNPDKRLAKRLAEGRRERAEVLKKLVAAGVPREEIDGLHSAARKAGTLLDQIEALRNERDEAQESFSAAESNALQWQLRAKQAESREDRLRAALRELRQTGYAGCEDGRGIAAWWAVFCRRHRIDLATLEETL